ncbi:hypothetical protein MP228_001995 [Amoeboaphelidium protococcarum]|nr:hypothetical protein MP228_001995 [Amoeboaphelidium protococcarum]
MLDALLQKPGKLESVLKRRITFIEAVDGDQEQQFKRIKQKYPPLNGKFLKSGQASVKQNNNVNEQPQISARVSSLPAVKELYPISKVVNTWSKVHSVGSGFNNARNTCFLNAVLQCLVYCPPLANFALSGDHKRICRANGFCSMCQMHHLIQRQLITNDKSPIYPSFIKALRIIAKSMRVGRQEDAHEFLRFLLDSMQNACINSYAAQSLPEIVKQTNPIFQIFGGQMQSCVKCGSCGSESITKDPMLDLTLDIANCPSVDRALQKFKRADDLSGCNSYKCEKCKKTTNAQKSMSISQVPNVLTIQLKRFGFGSFGGMMKLKKHVAFPETLDLSPALAKSVAQQSGTKYQLFAVLVHSGGSANSGHYYSYVKSPSGMWYQMDDTDVSKVKLSTVLSQQAYMLFYTRIQ